MADDEALFVCGYCQHEAPWTDGMSRAAGDERDEFWCPRCGEATPLTEEEAARG